MEKKIGVSLKGYKHTYEVEGSHFTTVTNAVNFAESTKSALKRDGQRVEYFEYGTNGVSRRTALRYSQQFLEDLKTKHNLGFVGKVDGVEKIRIPGLGITYARKKLPSNGKVYRRFTMSITDPNIGKVSRTPRNQEELASAWELLTKTLSEGRGFDEVPEHWTIPSETFLVRLLSDSIEQNPSDEHIDHHGVSFKGK